MVISMQAVAVSDAVLWVGLAGLILVSTVAGFVAGVQCAPWLQERALKRAARHVQRLFEFTAQHMERTSQLCQMLSDAATSPLASAQWDRLDTARKKLADSWKGMAERQVNSSSEVAGETCPTGSSQFHIDWAKGPVDATTQLPNRETFETNLQQLIQQSSEHCHPSGVLLFRVDKSDQLARRYGADALNVLQSKLATVVIKAARNEDLVCRLDGDLFAVLIPSVSPLAGARVAETIRAAVRDHAYRVEANGPEVLLTASFGYAVCLPAEPAMLVIDRASEALQKSQSAGRNQLHVHDATNRLVARIG
ncbi:diguanylate cyclase [bacterium]|nr:diguanylate cyclase [bacterium]